MASPSLNLAALSESLRTSVAFQFVEQFSKLVNKNLENDTKISYSELCHKQMVEGISSWKNGSQFRVCFDSLYKKQVAAIVEKHFSKEKEYRAVELGSGYLNYEMKSQLESALPQGFRFNVTLTDANTKIVEDAHTKISKNRFIHLNCAELKKSFAGSSLDAAMASCCLDTLHKEHLEKTLQQVVEILKDGGLFFHILDLVPFVSTIIGEYSENDNKILFPLIGEDEYIKGIQLVPRKKCEQFIKQNFAGDKKSEALFLKKFINQTSRARAIVVNDIGANPAIIQGFSDWVKRTFPKDRVEVINEEFYNQRLLDAVKGLNCEVLHCGPAIQMEDSLKSNIDPRDFNFMGSSQGKVTQLTNPKVPSNMIRKISQVHAFVIRKKSSTQ